MFKILSRSLDAIGIHGRKKSSAPRDPNKKRRSYMSENVLLRNDITDFCRNWCHHRRMDTGCELEKCPLQKHVEVKTP